MKGRIHLSTICLVTLGLADLAFTLVLMRQGLQEGNPIFRALQREYGQTGFIAGKVALLVGPVLLLEFVRTKHPKSAEQGTWIAFGAYFFLLAYQFLRLRG